jgi:hypothetical protein
MTVLLWIILTLVVFYRQHTFAGTTAYFWSQTWALRDDGDKLVNGRARRASAVREL